MGGDGWVGFRVTEEEAAQAAKEDTWVVVPFDHIQKQ